MVVVNDHHRVLVAWSQIRLKLSAAPRLITLDYHTDTSSPFRNYLKSNLNVIQDDLIKKINFKDLRSIEEAIELLSHDEHIVTAIKSDIISAAFIIAHNAIDTDLETFKNHKIMCCGLDSKSQNKVSRNICDRVLETDFLKSKIESFDFMLQNLGHENLLGSSYILDIDLDYLNTFKSICPSDSSFFKKLVQNAKLITVATEEAHVKMCAWDKDLDSKFLLSSLREIILN